jgi:hypothetical protein
VRTDRLGTVVRGAIVRSDRLRIVVWTGRLGKYSGPDGLGEVAKTGRLWTVVRTGRLRAVLLTDNSGH